MADQIVAEYTVKVDKALKDLDALARKVGKIDDERKKTEDGFSSMSKNLAGQFAKVGAALGLAFSAQQVVSVAKEMVNLALRGRLNVSVAPKYSQTYAKPQEVL